MIGIPGLNLKSSHTKDSKMVLDPSLLNPRQYKVWINGKVKQSGERSRALPQYLGVVAIEKEAFASLSTTVANFNYLKS